MVSVITQKMVGLLVKELPAAIIKRFVTVDQIARDFEIELSSPTVTSKPASQGRIKTSHFELIYL
jgi:hypothetical protein